jgi:hypothetical protein
LPLGLPPPHPPPPPPPGDNPWGGGGGDTLYVYIKFVNVRFIIVIMHFQVGSNEPSKSYTVGHEGADSLLILSGSCVPCGYW